jgi:hypothetical protein
MMRLLAAIIAVLMGIPATAPLGQPGPAWDFRSTVLLPLENGPNQLDLDGDGRADLVFVAWRENFNAHGFNQITFYRSTAKTPAWQLVPFFKKDGTSAFTSFQTYQGADCVLSDLRVLRPTKNPTRSVVAVLANRPLGNSFVDKRRVTFTVYVLTQNSEGIPGWPSFYFQAEDTITSKGAYCDVGDAFRSELGIGREHK